MRPVGFALLVVACVCLTFAIVQAAHIGISELHPRTYTVFRDPSDGSVISSGSVKCYEAEWDTTAADLAGYAWKFTRAGSGTATYFYFDDMPQTNCLTCYWRDGATVVCCAESLQFEGKALADSAVTSWEQIKCNVITRANMSAGDNWAWHTEIADSQFFVPEDTTWASSSSIATHAWVLNQGYGGAGSFNMEAAEDTTWGATGAAATGQAASNIDIVYDDGGNEVTFNIAASAVGDNEVNDNSLGAEKLIYSGLLSPDNGDMGWLSLEGGQYKVAWEKIENIIEAGNDLDWDTPSLGYLKKLNYTGSGGASQAQIMEWSADLFNGGSFDGLTKTESGTGVDRRIDIDATDITGAMITDESIKPRDLHQGVSQAWLDMPAWGNADVLLWSSMSDYRTNAVSSNWDDFRDDTAAFLIDNAESGIDVYYVGAQHKMGFAVWAGGNNIQDDVIQGGHLQTGALVPNIGDVAVIKNNSFHWEWQSLTDLLEGGVGLTVSTGSTASTCSLNVDFNLVDWPASVSTIQILTADIWRAEIDTLEAGRVTADSLTMLGIRWDDGAGKLLTSAFPDSADFASISTVALYINGETYQESTEDLVGAMMAGTRGADITVTYTDAAGEIDIDIDAAVTRDTEWDTAAEINAATTDDDFLIDGTDTVDAGNLKDDNTPADEDFYRYESTGATGHWTAASEIPSMLNSSTVQVLNSGRYAESAIDPSNRDSLCLAHAGVATGSTIISGWLKRPPWWNITIGKDAPYALSVISSSADHVTIHWTPPGATKSGGDAELWYYVLGTPP